MHIENSYIAEPVALDTWTVSPSIDFITIQVDEERSMASLRLVHRRPEIANKIEFPKRRNVRIFTIHDPSIDDLQTLLDLYPSGEIQDIEFTLDFRPKGGPASDDELIPALKWLNHSLFPNLPNARRLCYDEVKKRYVHEQTDSWGNNLTRRWEDRRQYVKYRLYIKKHDKRTEVQQPSVRLEVTFNRGGCQDHGIQWMWQLVDFAGRARTTLAPYFFIGAGIKPVLTRLDRYAKNSEKRALAALQNSEEKQRVDAAWKRFGAMWAIRNAYKVHPDLDTNRRIGKALDRLQSMLERLKLTNFSPVFSDLYQPLTRTNTGVSAFFDTPSIGVTELSKQVQRGKEQPSPSPPRTRHLANRLGGGRCAPPPAAGHSA